MQIEIVNVSLSTVPTAKGSYQVADVAYKNKSFQDKLEGKKVMSFVNKEVFATLSNAKFGDIFEVQRSKVAGKDGKEYWNWDSLGTGDGGDTSQLPAQHTPTAYTGPAKAGTVTPKSNYETSEERAARQVMIVRQSSLSTAVAILVGAADKKTVINPDTVIGVAKQLEAYVLGKDVDQPIVDLYQTEANETASSSSFNDFENDIPY